MKLFWELLLVFCSFSLWSNPAPTFLQKLIKPRSFTFTHGVQSPGLTGFEAGVGSHLLFSPDRPLLPDYLSEKRVYATPFINFLKGLPYVDLTAMVDLLSDTQAAWGVGLQIPLLDWISPLPSLGFRAGYMTPFTKDLVNWSSFNGELAASLALPPAVHLFELFGALGYAYYQLQDSYQVFSQSWQDLYATLGTRLTLFPLVGLTFQTQIYSGVQSYLVKLSVQF